MIPAAIEAGMSRELSGEAKRVYFALLAQLDFTSYRPVKYLEICQRLRGRGGRPMRKQNVHRAVHRLLALGYLARGAKQDGRWTYLLRYTREVSPAITAAAS